MSSPYAGVAAFPASILLPDDGEPIEAGAVAVPVEGLADRTVWLYEKSFATVEFLVTTPAWVAPAGVAFAVVEGFGSGGGGGGGTDGLAVDNSYAMAGAGGGAAPVQQTVIPLVPGQTYYIEIPAGGAGGVNGAPGATEGSPGQAATVTRVSSGEVLCEFGGGGGGGAGASNGAPPGTFLALGGSPWASFDAAEWVGPNEASPKQVSYLTSSPNVQYPLPPGSGGASVSKASPGSRAGRNGISQQTRVRHSAGLGTPGFGGAQGGDSGLRRGGGGGGGGGGGATGSAGSGGDGGAGNNGGVAVAGGNGTNAAPNSGGGGGGGGGGGAGNGPANNGAGGLGGAGGSARMRFFCFGVRP